MSHGFGLAEVVFFIALGTTFAAAIAARLKSQPSLGDEDLAGRKLNRWLVGLSAATTGNSGFIVTGAVGLGYVGGVQWLMLPLSWLVGDLVFWSIFPSRLNRLAREANATTISELLTYDLSGRASTLISITVSVILVIFLTTYTSAQWLSGRKFLSSVFHITSNSAIIYFGATIIFYSSIGGFKGSVYTDAVQAVIRVGGTIVALAAVIWFANAHHETFATNMSAVGRRFWIPFPNGTLITALGFVAGYASAAVGFGLGQPQIVTRYLAGSSPEETRSARWIYIAFLQGTWLAMTAFGILLRGVMPGITDPETGLSVFFQTHVGAIATGIIFADVYATIASTSNGILVAISQTVRYDLFKYILGYRQSSWIISSIVTLLVGVVSIGFSFILPGNVFSIAIDAVSKIGAGLAGPVMIKLFRWRHTGWSLLAAILGGIAVSFVWKQLGFSSVLNEAAIGIAVSLFVNWAGTSTTRHYIARNARSTFTLNGERGRTRNE